MNNTENTLAVPNIRKLIVLPLFAALIAVGSYITVPVGPVPIVLQNFFVALAGLVLGPAAGAASVCLFLLMGLIGLPVFAGGTGGIAHFAAPAAGFLVAYPVMAWVTGIISSCLRKAAPGKNGKMIYLKDFVAALVGGGPVVYAIALVWLKIRLGLDWPKTFAVGFLPFFPGDIIKYLAAALLAPRFRAIFRTEGIGAEK